MNNITDKKNEFNKYSISLDLVQFVCYNNTNELQKRLADNTIQLYTVEKRHNRNPNFRYNYKIHNNSNEEIADIFIVPSNHVYKYDEVLIKISNHLLYQQNLLSTIENLLHNLNLTFIRINELHIAIDSMLNAKIMDILRRISKGHKTIALNNNTIKLSSDNFDYNNEKYTTYHLGSKKSDLTASVYNKTLEITASGKDYIKQYWALNGLDITKEIFRFEVKLKYKRIKKYNLTLSMINKVNVLSAIIVKEIKENEWINFYNVKARDKIKLNEKKITKQTLIKRGSKIRWMHWNHFPSQMELLTNNIAPNHKQNINKYKTTITTLLQKIKGNLFISYDSELEIIRELALKYNLETFTQKKISDLFYTNQSNKMYQELHSQIYKLDDELELYKDK